MQGADESPTTTTIGKFTQTWRKQPGDTTCDDWRLRMDAHEQTVMAADMLTSAWKVDGVEKVPPDALIADFQDGVENVCSVEVAGTQTMDSVGAGIYVTDSPRFNP